MMDTIPLSPIRPRSWALEPQDVADSSLPLGLHLFFSKMPLSFGEVVVLGAAAVLLFGSEYIHPSPTTCALPSSC